MARAAEETRAPGSDWPWRAAWRRLAWGLCLAATSEERLAEAKKRLEPHGVRVETVALDVAEREACFDLVQQAIGWFGQLDILVNNAATYIPKPFLDYSFEDFDVVGYQHHPALRAPVAV